MDSVPLTLVTQVNIDSSHQFIVVITPKSPMSASQFQQLIKTHQSYLLDTVVKHGVVLLRGFTEPTVEIFNQVVSDSLGLQPWNSFNVKNMPGFVASWLRKYSERLVGAGDYRRYIDSNTVQLGPAENAVQGPHVEGGIRSERARFLSLCCFEPAPYLGETGMVSFKAIFDQLAPDMQQKYQHARSRFYYISARKINWFDRILLKNSPFTIERQADGHAKMILPLCPIVCKVPETNDVCIQPWAFAKNTNDIVYQAAVDAYGHRGQLKKDNTADGMNLTWDLCTPEGKVIDWTDAEKKQLFDSIYQQATLVEWQKGDIAIVDNVRIGHWRMNGEQGQRKLVQIQTNVFNAEQYMP